jgi:hypothetical protein
VIGCPNFHKLIYLLDSSYKSLNIEVSTKEIESISFLVHEAMSSRERKYHRVQHLLDISKEADPLETVAILFHDVVYIQVDKRIHTLLKPHLKDFTTFIKHNRRRCLAETRPHSFWLYSGPEDKFKKWSE